MILSEEIQEELHKIALQINKTEEEILWDALKFYKEFIRIQKEFKMWNEISNTDPSVFEANIKNGHISFRDTKD